MIPINRDTEKLYYGQRLIIDAPVLTEPRAFEITKINRISPNGVIRVTLAQGSFNPHTDYIEIDENGNVVGMWADYWKEGVEPESPEEAETNTYAKITYSGAQNRQLKIGGNYKKFNVNFYDSAGELNHLDGEWSFTIDDTDASETVDALTTENDASIPENQLRLKFIGGYEYIGKDLTITYTSTSGVKGEVVMNIIGI